MLNKILQARGVEAARYAIRFSLVGIPCAVATAVLVWLYIQGKFVGLAADILLYVCVFATGISCSCAAVLGLVCVHFVRVPDRRY